MTGLIDAVCAPAALAIENERLQAELRAQIEEVSVSARRLRDVLENVHLIAVSLDLDGRIVVLPTSTSPTSPGWTRDRARRQRCGSERFPTGDPHYLDRVHADRIRVHDEMPLQTRSGDVRPIRGQHPRPRR